MRVLLPVAFAWVAISGCGPGPEGRPARVVTSAGLQVAPLSSGEAPCGAGRERSAIEPRDSQQARRAAGDPILERIEALARKDSSATKPSLTEMLPALKSASVPYDIAGALGRRPPRVAARAPAPPPGEKPAPPKAEAAQAKETPVPAPPSGKPGAESRAPQAPRAHRAAPPGEEAGDEFRLGPGDEIRLTVDGQPEFSGAVAVREDGTVVLPSTGDPVPASGRTLEELARAVAGAISPRYVKKRPAVSAKLLRSPGSPGAPVRTSPGQRQPGSHSERPSGRELIKRAPTGAGGGGGTP